MMQLSSLPYLLIPLFLLGIPAYGASKGIDVYACFIEGASDGLKVAAKIAPAMIAMFLVVGLLRNSGALDILAQAVGPATMKLGINPDLVMLAILRPISGSGALSLLANILKDLGPDTFDGKLASVIQGASDTSIYILALYFSSVNVSKWRHSAVAALLANAVGFVAAIIACNIIFR